MGAASRPTGRTLTNRRKTIAAFALLLASSLEICGCNLMWDCEEVRGLQVGSVTWSRLAARCRECLSAQELARLKRVSDRLASAAVAGSFDPGETVGQALLEGRQISFFDPGTAVEEAANSPEFESPPAHSVAGPGLWPIPQSVFFVYRSASPGRAARRVPAATAFVLSVPGRDHRRSVRFLVTARHVVDPEWAHCEGKNPASIDLRLNRRAGGVGYETIPLQADHGPRFLTSEDNSADVAVARLDDGTMPNLEGYTFLDTPFRLLPTAAELRAIGQGDPNDGTLAARRVVTAGMGSRSPRDERSYPVSDAGVLESATTQPVEIRCGAAANPTRLGLWTIEAAVPPGVSGAPVYTTLVRGAKNTRTPVLLGVQSISWPDQQRAGMTPSTALSDLIERALADESDRMDFYKGPGP